MGMPSVSAEVKPTDAMGMPSVSAEVKPTDAMGSGVSALKILMQTQETEMNTS
jgi:hypothetical protein